MITLDRQQTKFFHCTLGVLGVQNVQKFFLAQSEEHFWECCNICSSELRTYKNPVGFHRCTFHSNITIVSNIIPGIINTSLVTAKHFRHCVVFISAKPELMYQGNIWVTHWMKIYFYSKRRTCAKKRQQQRWWNVTLFKYFCTWKFRYFFVMDAGSQYENHVQLIDVDITDTNTMNWHKT